MSERILDGVGRLIARLAGDPLVIHPEGLVRYVLDRPERLDRGRVGERSAALDLSGGVAVIPVAGVMVPQGEYYGDVSTQQIAQQLRAAAADENVTATVLLINSPGGMAMGQIELMEAAAEAAAAKPLVAQVAGWCCSGAYWLASACEAIYAHPSDQVGSIGVRTHRYDLSEMFASFGIRVVDVATGPLKSAGLPGTPTTAEQETEMRERVAFVMDKFDAAVRAGRGFTAEQFTAVATGGVWYAEQALPLGLIDGLQPLSATLAGIASRFSQQPDRSQVMADQQPQPTGPQPATLAELKKAMPTASAEFQLAQLEAGATLNDALSAYAKELAEQNQQLAAEKAQAEEAAKKAAEQRDKEQAAGEKPKRGAPALGATGEESTEEVDYRELAREYQAKHNCRWSEACLEIKRRYPEARAYFGAPPTKSN